MYSCRGGTYLIIPVVSLTSFKSFYFPVAPGLFTGYPSLCFKERLRLQSSSQILKHLYDFSLPNVGLGLQSFQCSKIRSAQHWERRAAHLSENKGVKGECKKFGENSRKMFLFQRFVTSIAILVTNLYYRDLYGDAHLDELQHGGRKPTETSVTEFCYKSVNLFFEKLINIKVILFLIHKLFR